MKKMEELIKELKPCWEYAAMDYDGSWYVFTHKPKITAINDEREEWTLWECLDEGKNSERISDLFEIENFSGSWKDSLIERK